ncbi:MAG: 3-isopropylmalate dehydrogenase [Firmicutes bacterium]|nr:3-isopropylmalate dehydrogenase [Bacillota bacterium]MDI6705574.1 isocitrate/isopropylmalate family dehydrogenase [Bacillota bacterium]
MKNYSIALLPGDGVGPEVIDGAKQVLEAVEKKYQVKFNFEEYLIGKKALDEKGDQLPLDTLNGIKNADAALMATPAVAELPPPSVVGRLRRELNLYADVRMVKSFDGTWSLKPGIDIVFIRECTEGFLADRNLYRGFGEFMPTEDCVMSLRVLTGEACRRIAKFAFDYAAATGRKTLTVAHKANVLRWGCGFFLEKVREVSKKYPAVTLKEESVDSLANHLITDPLQYDIILTTNMFGDILSDEGAALVSNLVSTANIGEFASVYAPVDHNPRWHEAGKDITNPLPLILCTGMMLMHLGMHKACADIERAVSAVLKCNIKTMDMNGNSSTSEVIKSVCERFKHI